MQQLFAQLEERLRQFVAQRDCAMLLVRTEEAGLAFVTRALQTIDEQDPFNPYWFFAHDFRDAASYVTDLLAAFRPRYELQVVARRKEGLTAWPPLPPSLEDIGRPPSARLKSLMEYSRLLVTDPHGVAVWALLPLRVVGREEYQQLCAALAPERAVQPWCHHLRIVLRDAADGSLLEASVASRPAVALFTPEVEAAHVQASIEAAAGTASMPLDQRMHSLLMLAAIDCSHAQYALALEKYVLLLRYFRATENRTMEALVMNELGRLHELTGDRPKAKQLYEAALTPALASQQAQLVLMLALGLANLALAERQWSAAAGYLEQVERLALLRLMPQVAVYAAEQQAVCQAGSGESAEAAAHLERSASYARKIADHDLLRGVLTRHLGMLAPDAADKQRAIVAELAKLSPAAA